MPLPIGIGSIVAVVLEKILDRIAQGDKSVEISDSQLVQVARTTVIGAKVNVTVPGQEIRPTFPEPRDELVRRIVTECIMLVTTQPDLRVTLLLGPGGERRLSIERPGSYRPPSAADIESAGRIFDPVSHSPFGSAADDLAGGGVSPPGRMPAVTRRSAADYAADARRLMEEDSDD